MRLISPNQENILEEIINERYRQDGTWHEQNHTPMEWLPILMEEVGEASKAALEAYFSDYYTGTLSDYREECVHVAAVAMAMVECFDRNAGGG